MINFILEDLVLRRVSGSPQIFRSAANHKVTDKIPFRWYLSPSKKFPADC